MIALLARGWPVFLVVVVANAVVQAATVAPSVTPSASPEFVGLAVVSALSFASALVLTVAQVRAGVDGKHRPQPRRVDVAASLTFLLAVAVAGIASSWLMVPVIVVALPVFAGFATGRGAAGFAVFHGAPVRSLVLTLFTLVIIGLLWLGALLLGFFITGWPAAILTWLAYGTIGTALLCAWAALARPATTSTPSTTSAASSSQG